MMDKGDPLGGFLHWLHTDAGAAAMAGAAGGLVRWVTLRESWREGLGALLVGAICAQYLGPLVVPMLAPVVGPIAGGDQVAGFSAFVVGLGGIGIAGFVIDTLRRFQADKAGDNDNEK